MQKKNVLFRIQLLAIILFSLVKTGIAQSIKTKWSEPQKLTTWISDASIVNVDKEGVYILEKAFTKNRTFGFVGFANPKHIYKVRKLDNTLIPTYNKEIKKEDNDDEYITYTFKSNLYFLTASYDKKLKVTKFLSAKINSSGEPGKWIELAVTHAGLNEIVEYNVGFNSDSSRIFFAYLEKSEKGERLAVVNFDENLSLLNIWNSKSLFPLGIFDITTLIQTEDNSIIVAAKEYKIIQKVKKGSAAGSKILESVLYSKNFDEGDRKFQQCALKYFDNKGELLQVKGLDDYLKNAYNIGVTNSISGYIVSGLTTSNKDSGTINGAYFITINGKSPSVVSTRSYSLNPKLFEKLSKDSRMVKPAEILYNRFDSSIYLLAEEVQWSGRSKPASGQSNSWIYERSYMNGDLFVIKKNIYTDSMQMNKIVKAQFTTREFFDASMIPEETTTFFHQDWSSTFKSRYFAFPKNKGIRVIYNDNSNSLGYKKMTMTNADFESMRNADCYYAAAFNSRPLKKVILRNEDGFIANPEFRSGNTFYFLGSYVHSLAKDEIKVAKVVISED